MPLLPVFIVGPIVLCHVAVFCEYATSSKYVNKKYSLKQTIKMCIKVSCLSCFSSSFLQMIRPSESTFLNQDMQSLYISTTISIHHHSNKTFTVHKTHANRVHTSASEPLTPDVRIPVTGPSRAAASCLCVRLISLNHVFCPLVNTHHQLARTPAKNRKHLIC